MLSQDQAQQLQQVRQVDEGNQLVQIEEQQLVWLWGGGGHGKFCEGEFILFDALTQ